MQAAKPIDLFRKETLLILHHHLSLFWFYKSIAE